MQLILCGRVGVSWFLQIYGTYLLLKAVKNRVTYDGASRAFNMVIEIAPRFFGLPPFAAGHYMYFRSHTDVTSRCGSEYAWTKHLFVLNMPCFSQRSPSL